MTLFSIDERLCRQDGICAAECPMGIISWKKSNFPKPAASAQSLCINCGHCVAVCPHGALTHANMGVEDCLAVEKEKQLSPELTEHFLRGRRSIRSFKETPVKKETLTEIIRLASFAPSGHNMQPVSWQVLNTRNSVEAHAELVIDWMKLTLKEKPALGKALHFDRITTAWKFKMDTVTRSAPTLILALGPAGNMTAPTACTIAMTYLDLAAQSFGVGTCWCGYFLMAAQSHEPLAQKLGLDQKLKPYAVMMAGYPRFAYHRMPPRNTPPIAWG